MARMKSRNEYLNVAYLLPKTYKASNEVEHSEIGLLFYYKNYQGRKSTIQREIRVIENEESGRVIETNSTLGFKTDDLISINGVVAYITKIEVISELPYGAIRNRPNREKYIITLA